MDLKTYVPDYTDRAKLANTYHAAGYNCVQAVAGAFADQINMPLESLIAIGGGFGGGIGGTHEEICGAASGAIMALSLLYPFVDGDDQAGKKRIYVITKEFRKRFQDVFGHTVCGNLLEARPGVTEKTPAAARLGLKRHCDIMIVTAVDIVEEMLREFER